MRKAIIDKLSAGEIRVLVTVNTISEGVNICAADTALFVEPRGSHIAVNQILGRVMRRSPLTHKTLATIILPTTDEQEELARFILLLSGSDARLKKNWRTKTSILNTSGVEMDTKLLEVKIYDRIGKLVAVDNVDWINNLKLVKKYIEEFGCLPKHRGGGKGDMYKGHPVGRWCVNQQNIRRGNMHNTFLTKTQIKLLEELPGWEWGKPVDSIWKRKYAALKDYLAKFGKIPDLKVDHGEKLGAWVYTQKAARDEPQYRELLLPEYLTLLGELGI